MLLYQLLSTVYFNPVPLKNLIEILEWDSKFFEKKVCSVVGTVNNEEEAQTLFTHLAQNEIDLAYYSSAEPLNNELQLPDHYSFEFVDKKTTYKKALNGHAANDLSVHPYEKVTPEPKLMDLAVESGVFSRFKVDKHIGEDKFEELYHTWMVNSVNKKIAKEVLVYQPKEEVEGFVTLGEKNSSADIGLIAIDVMSRGKGIGKTLMRNAETWFVQHTDYAEIQVVTQGSNIAACRLYESCGYHVSKVEYTYHLWKKRNSLKLGAAAGLKAT